MSHCLNGARYSLSNPLNKLNTLCGNQLLLRILRSADARKGILLPWTPLGLLRHGIFSCSFMLTRLRANPPFLSDQRIE